MKEYTIAGKVRQNIDGKVVLSTRAFVPREIPGTLLREWVNEWHCRSPNQLSMAALVHMILTEHMRLCTPASTVPSFQLSTVDRIIALEAELFNLHARKSVFTLVARTRAQRVREGQFGASIEEVDEPPPIPVIALAIIVDALSTVYTMQCTQKQHPKPTEGVGATVM